jgi:flagellar motor switch protein FliM
MELDRRWVRLLSHEIQAAELQLVAELARTDATIEQLLAMQVGDFLELERVPSIQAKVEGVPLFECQYGTHKGKYALRIDRKLRGSEMTWLGDSYVN